MRRTGPYLVFAGFLAVCSPCFADEQFQEIRKFFEWGEYDSLFLKAVELSQNGLSKSLKAELRKYLAVGEYDKGNILQAQKLLLESFSLDSTSELDPMYVSEAVMAFFVNVKAKWFKDKAAADLRRKETAVSKDNDSAQAGPAPVTANRNKGNRDIETVPYTRKLNKPMLYMAGGGLVVSVVFGYLTYREYDEGDKNYKLLQTASDEGRVNKFKKLRSAVEDNNKWIIIYGTGTAAFFSAGTYFLVRGLMGKKISEKKLSRSGGFYTDFKVAGFHIGYKHRF